MPGKGPPPPEVSMIKCGRLAAPVKIGGGGCVGLTVAGIGVIYSFGVVLVEWVLKLGWEFQLMQM
ncbi:MAG: hypothetical protein IPJ46_17810 [Anaerolineales bacterium]|nr:hypothetical protein [Anaerolineales bacterium]